MELPDFFPQVLNGETKDCILTNFVEKGEWINEWCSGRVYFVKYQYQAIGINCRPEHVRLK